MLNNMERLEKTLFRLEQGMIKLWVLHYYSDYKITLDKSLIIVMAFFTL